MTYSKESGLTPREMDRIIEMAWEDRTPFDAIEYQFGIPEKEVIEIMRKSLKRSSWRRWRARVQGRRTKHRKLAANSVRRFKSRAQSIISSNRISKRN